MTTTAIDYWTAYPGLAVIGVLGGLTTAVWAVFYHRRLPSAELRGSRLGVTWVLAIGSAAAALLIPASAAGEPSTAAPLWRIVIPLFAAGFPIQVTGMAVALSLVHREVTAHPVGQPEVENIHEHRGTVR